MADRIYIVCEGQSEGAFVKKILGPWFFEMVSGMNPEDINNGNETAPSKRLLNALHYHKGETVVYPLELIGIEQMLEKCPHFQSWIKHLINVSKI